jgi:hypothetical protein
MLCRVAKKVVLEWFLLCAKSQKDAVASFTRHGLPEEYIGESLLQVMVGSDTSAATIHVVLLNLLINPPCYRRLQVEVDSAVVAAKFHHQLRRKEAILTEGCDKRGSSDYHARHRPIRRTGTKR